MKKAEIGLAEPASWMDMRTYDDMGVHLGVHLGVGTSYANGIGYDIEYAEILPRYVCAL